MKAQEVPRHFSITATPAEMERLVLMARTFCREYESDDLDEAIRETLEDTYDANGRLGSPPGEPIDDDADKV